MPGSGFNSTSGVNLGGSGGDYGGGGGGVPQLKQGTGGKGGNGVIVVTCVATAAGPPRGSLMMLGIGAAFEGDPPWMTNLMLPKVRRWGF